MTNYYQRKNELTAQAAWHEVEGARLMGTCDLISVTNHFEAARVMRETVATLNNIEHERVYGRPRP